MTTATHPRERLIQTAATLVHRQGWTITGINQILTDAGIPKGSFYYYFRSKEALGVAVLQLYVSEIKRLVETTLLNKTLEPEAAVDAFMFEISRGSHAAIFRYGCPVSNLASETATQCAPLLAEAVRGVDLYRDAWRQLITRSQDARTAALSDLSPEELAKIIVMLLQGAFLGLKCAAGDTQALDTAHVSVRSLIFGGRSGAALSARLAAEAAAQSAPRALAS